ncbi:MAG: DUF975 family protein [Peptococcia bacterium]
MEISRAELKRNALDSLKGNWGIAVAVTLIYLVICSVIGVIPVIGWIAAIICTPALVLGLQIFFLKMARNQDPEVQDLFAGFSSFGKAFCLYFVMYIFILLWTLLFIIPGIIASFRYSMAFFILADNPEIGVLEAIRQSKEMMVGHKWRLFVLGLSFLGWAILATLTFGIGYLWLCPYMITTISNFYRTIKGEPLEAAAELNV